MDGFEHSELALRLATAALAGMAVGLDREARGFSAGLRTHGLVALSSAAVTVSALSLRAELGADVDPLRVIQGLAQIVGLIAAGVIFTTAREAGDPAGSRRQRVHNLTSAANIWIAASLGVAAGAGHYVLVAATLAFAVAIVTLVRVLERLIPGSIKSGDD